MTGPTPRNTKTAERRRNEGIGGLAAVRGQIIEALRAEDAAAQAAMAATTADTSGWTAEMREFHQLGQRTSITGVHGGDGDRLAPVDAAPRHEYNDACFRQYLAAVGEYPLEMLLDRSEYFSLDCSPGRASLSMPDAEQRTEITGVVAGAGNLKPTLTGLMADSEGAYLRATYPVVGPGRHSVP